MPRKKKGQLPSGSIRIQKKVGIREDGKRIMKSFTGATRDEAEHAYRMYMAAGGYKEKKKTLTVQKAVERYIDSKRNVLSPATVRSYGGLLRTHVEGTELGDTDIDDVSTKEMQLWISDLSTEVTPKTVRNAFALVQASIGMFVPDVRFRVTLPQKVAPNLYCPSDEDVSNILKYTAEHDPDLEKAILLAAFGPLRRSEICALESSDIKGNAVSVTKAMVYTEDHEWVVKTTKTVGSSRTVRVPDFVAEKISGAEGRVVDFNPNQITAHFERALKRSDSKVSFRFHDLRHYAASIMHAIGVPDQYIMARGGWSSDNVMKRVYRNVIDIEEVRQTEKILEHFQKVSHGS